MQFLIDYRDKGMYASNFIEAIRLCGVIRKESSPPDFDQQTTITAVSGQRAFATMSYRDAMDIARNLLVIEFLDLKTKVDVRIEDRSLIHEEIATYFLQKCFDLLTYADNIRRDIKDVMEAAKKAAQVKSPHHVGQ